MIKIKGRKAVFTGKDAKMIKSTAKSYGMSQQDVFTGVLWEYVMKCARERMFKGDKNAIHHKG